MKISLMVIRMCMVGLCFLFVVSLSAASASSSSTVYDNSDLINGYGGWNYYYNGNQITLGGTDRTITDFTFYYTIVSDISNASAHVYFLENDRESGAPGSVLYNSGEITIFKSEENDRYTISNMNILVPDTFTWIIGFNLSSYAPASIQANSISNDESPIITFPQTVSGVTVGQWNSTWYYDSYLDKWLEDIAPDGFSPTIYAATFQATTVPVPGSASLLFFSLVCLTLIKRKRVQ